MAKWNPLDDFMGTYETYGNMFVPKSTYIGGLGSNKTFYIPATFTCCGRPSWPAHPNNYSDGYDQAQHKNDIHMQGATHTVYTAAPNDEELAVLGYPKISDGLKEYTSQWMVFHKTGPVVDDYILAAATQQLNKTVINLLDKKNIAQLLENANKKWVFFNDNARHGHPNFTLRDGTESPAGVKRYVESNFTFLPYVWHDQSIKVLKKVSITSVSIS